MIPQFKIIHPGPFTTVQDRGRYGYQRFGVPITGVLDGFAAQVANLLVGNSEDAAVLEFTFMGSEMVVLTAAEIAVTGAQMPVKLNGVPVPGWTCLGVQKNDVVTIGQAQAGCRGYLAVNGGFDVPMVMGSRSSYTGAKIGGMNGRTLAAGDILHCGSAEISERCLSLPTEYLPQYTSDIVLRAVAGPQDDFFDEGLDLFFSSEFTVSPQANRMGYRLQGAAIAPKPGMPKSIISEPSLPGGVQVPPDGQPIILLVEQTVGGYSKIATVISSDIPKVAQALPEDRIRFERVDLQTAYQIKKDMRQSYNTLKTYINSDTSSSTRVTGSWPGEAINAEPELLAAKYSRHLLQI